MTGVRVACDFFCVRGHEVSEFVAGVLDVVLVVPADVSLDVQPRVSRSPTFRRKRRQEHFDAKGSFVVRMRLVVDPIAEALFETRRDPRVGQRKSSRTNRWVPAAMPAVKSVDPGFQRGCVGLTCA